MWVDDIDEVSFRNMPLRNNFILTDPSISRSRLDVHMRVHTQKRDYKCPHCPKSFYVNTVLTLHLRSHSGEKPYVCHVCHAANSHRILYVKHMKKFHPQEEIYKLCDMQKIIANVAVNGQEYRM